MSALVVEYQKMQRELFEIVERFVVLNDTAYRMLVADGSPAEKLADQPPGRQPASASGASPGPTSGRRPSPCASDSPDASIRRKASCRSRARRGRSRADVDFRIDIRAPVLDAGARAIEAELRRLAGGDSRIHFEPAVSSDEIPAVLDELDVLLSPSLWFENGPTIALEAMAVGTPIIATRVGNLAELIQDGVNGRLVEAGSVAELSAAMLRGRDQPRDRRSTSGAVGCGPCGPWTTSRATT